MTTVISRTTPTDLDGWLATDVGCVTSFCRNEWWPVHLEPSELAFS